MSLFSMVSLAGVILFSFFGPFFYTVDPQYFNPNAILLPPSST